MVLNLDICIQTMAHWGRGGYSVSIACSQFLVVLKVLNTFSESFMKICDYGCRAPFAIFWSLHGIALKRDIKPEQITLINLNLIPFPFSVTLVSLAVLHNYKKC